MIKPHPLGLVDLMEIRRMSFEVALFERQKKGRIVGSAGTSAKTEALQRRLEKSRRAEMGSCQLLLRTGASPTEAVLIRNRGTRWGSRILKGKAQFQFLNVRVGLGDPPRWHFAPGIFGSLALFEIASFFAVSGERWLAPKPLSGKHA